MGTGGAGGAFHRYVSVENVIKFGLRHPAFPAGQYAIYSWPEGSGYGPDSCKFVTYAYKRV